jgi:hypothetical protein
MKGGCGIAAAGQLAKSGVDMVEARRKLGFDCVSAVAAAEPVVAAGSAWRELLEALEQLGLGDAVLRGQLADDMAGVVAGFLAAFGDCEARCAEVRIQLADGQVRRHCKLLSQCIVHHCPSLQCIACLNK